MKCFNYNYPGNLVLRAKFIRIASSLDNDPRSPILMAACDLSPLLKEADHFYPVTYRGESLPPDLAYELAFRSYVFVNESDGTSFREVPEDIPSLRYDEDNHGKGQVRNLFYILHGYDAANFMEDDRLLFQVREIFPIMELGFRFGRDPSKCAYLIFGNLPDENRLIATMYYLSTDPEPNFRIKDEVNRHRKRLGNILDDTQFILQDD